MSSHAHSAVEFDSDGVTVRADSASDGETSPHGGTILAVMPFHSSFDDVYDVAIVGAAIKLRFTPVRVDRLMHGRDSTLETKRQISRCTALVADLSTGEPDVLYEVGYAHALGKPTVLVSNSPPEKLPFMVRNSDIVMYEIGRTHRLTAELTRSLATLLGSIP